MRRLLFFMAGALTLSLASCSYQYGYPDPQPPKEKNKYHITYSVVGEGTITTANISYHDGNSLQVDIANESLPWTMDFPAVEGGNSIYLWAQNTSADFVHDLTVTINKDKQTYVRKARGLYSVAAQGPYSLNEY
jgi:hypothetical protein